MRRFGPAGFTLLQASTVAWASTTPSASKWNFAKCDQLVELKHDPKLFEKLMPGPLSVGEEMLLACPPVDSGTSNQEILDMKVSSAEKVLKAAFGPVSFSHLTFEERGVIKLHGLDYSKVSGHLASLTPEERRERVPELKGELQAESRRVETLLRSLRWAPSKGGEENNIGRMTTVWLELSGLGACGFEIRGADERQFTFRGQPNVTPIPDSLLIETETGELVLVAENKAGSFVQADGHLGQLYAEMLCCLWNSIQGKSHPPSKKLRIYGIRMLNHHASFYRLDSTVKQLQQVCDLKPKKFPRDYKKMVLRSHTAKPNQTTKQAKKAKVKDIDFLGMSLADPVQRKEAQRILSKIR